MKGTLKRRPIQFFNFLSSLGVFSQEVPKGTLGSVERENSKGRIVYENYVNYLAGKLVAVRRNDQDKFGVRFEIGIFDEKENTTYFIALGYDAYNTRGVLNKLSSLEPGQLEKDFVFYVYQTPDKKDPSRKNSWIGVAVTDDLDHTLNDGFNALYDQRLVERFEKAHLPAPGKRMQSGKEYPDYTQQTELLWETVETDIVPHIQPPSAFLVASRHIDEARAEDLPPSEEIHSGVFEGAGSEEVFDRF